MALDTSYYILHITILHNILYHFNAINKLIIDLFNTVLQENLTKLSC